MEVPDMKAVLAAYEPVALPFTLDFASKTRSELAAYADWFVRGIERRVTVLETSVGSTRGYEGWAANASPDSLDSLGSWLVGVLEARQRSAEEIATVRAGLKFDVNIPKQELSPRSLSVCFDVGVYLGGVVLRNVPNVKWTQLTKDRRNVDYGQMVLRGPGPVPFNPVRIVMVLADKIIEGRDESAELRRLFEYWSGYPAFVGLPK
jgi:hypothetical protein